MSARAEARSTRPTGTADHRALGGVFSGAVTIAAIACVYSAHGALAYNPIALPLEKQARAPMFLPQGWKFFTRDPREEREAFYRRTERGAWQDASTGHNAEPRNGFGLSRGARAQGVEFGILGQAIPPSAWAACEEAPTACLERAPLALEMTNASPMPTLCGEIGFVMQKPVPWAWSKSASTITMPSRVVRVRVSC